VTDLEKQAIRTWHNDFLISADSAVNFTKDGEVEVLGTNHVYITMKSKNLQQISVRFKSIPAGFSCGHNDLIDLTNAPQRVPGSFWVSLQPNLQSLKGGPQWVGNTFDMQHSTPKNLEGLPLYVGEQIILRYQQNIGLLRLCLVQGKPELNWNYNRADAEACLVVGSIIDRYLGKGREAIIPCAAELHKAGYGANAKL
jgi:hypothetical protein